MVVVKPSEMGRFAEFRELVIASGEVNPNGLTTRLRACRVLAYILEENEVISVAAVKSPFLEHRRDIAVLAGVNLDACTTELGYFHTKAGHGGKGHGGALADSLLPHLSAPSYATTREDNTFMQRILTKRGFAQSGTSWPSQMNPTKGLTLWVRP